MNAPAHFDPRVELAFNGQALYGDDFSDDEIAAWFEDEREGYFNLYGTLAPGDGDVAEYTYAELAAQHGFNWLPKRDFPSVLGIGSAEGQELRPLLARSRDITVLEPSDGYAATEIDGKPVTYAKPSPTGLMPFDAESFDAIVCFNVLHHIPNVSTVMREIYRVLKPNGYVLLREPTHSMGDWRRPRRGLTKRERGIPLDIFRSMILDAGFEIVRETRCTFSLMERLQRFTRRPIWAVKWIVQLDRLICMLPVWPRRYHASRVWHKIRPITAAYVLRKT